MITTAEKTITYDRTTRDFAAYLDDVLVGFFGSYHAAEVALDQAAYEWLPLDWRELVIRELP